MATLILTLPAERVSAATLFDYVTSDDLRTPLTQASAPAALLPAATEVVAVVPVRALSWHLCTLPKGSLGKRLVGEADTPRLRQVLDGLLEEHLLDEPAQLHMAVAPQARPDGAIWVAVCERAWLRGALQVLEQAERAPSRIVPELGPEPAPDLLHVLGVGDEAQLVFAAAEGGLQVLPLGASALARANWPSDAQVLAEPGNAQQAEQALKSTVLLQSSAERSLQAAQGAWDLAQFDLQNSTRTRLRKHLGRGLQTALHAPRWRAARWSLLALVVVQLAGLNVLAWRERASLQAKQQAITQVLASTFTNVPVIVDAPVQMSKEVGAMRRASGAPSEQDFEALATALGSAAPPGLAFTSLDFAAGELKGRGVRLSLAQTAELTARLRNQGYLARIEGDSLTLQWSARP